MTKESRQVEAARSKNSAYDKRLSDQISDLDLELKTRRVRLLSDEANTKDFLNGILSTRGYSTEGRNSEIEHSAKVRQRRRRSRSLSKFDEKLREIREARRTERYKTSSFQRFPVTNLTEFRIKRNLYRSKSEHNLLKECEKNNPSYKITAEQETVFPLYQRKTIAQDAYRRAQSVVETPLRRKKTVKGGLILANDWFDLSSSWPQTKDFTSSRTTLPSLVSPSRKK